MVVLIVGLGIAVVSLNVGSNRSRQLLVEARALANDTAAVADAAVLDTAPWGLQFYREQAEGKTHIGYRWLRLGAGWQPQVPPRLDAGGRFQRDVEAVLVVEGSEQPIEPLPPASARPRPGAPQPHIWMAPGGEITPFELRLSLPAEDAAVVVRGDALGRLELVSGDAS